MPAEEGVAASGFDGVLDGGQGGPWVPAGATVWEMGAGQNPKDKAQKDYAKRTQNPLGAEPGETAFVFVTPRRWEDGKEWAAERREEGIWRDVAVIDAERLHAWLEATPDVHVWLSERLGFRPLSVRTLALVFELLAARTRPPLPPTLLLAGRDEQAEALRSALSASPAVVAVRGGSREEAVAFMAAALDLGGINADQAPDQPLWVRDATAFERLTLSERPMSLVVAIDDVEIGEALTRGHHVLLALGRGDYERSGVIALPRPARTPAREALEGADLSLERADRLAVLARRSFSALLREMSVTRAGARPGWARGADAPLLAGLLILGGWEGLEAEDEVILAVTGRTRAQVEERLATLSTNDDSPWTRSGGSWRLVSADDGFALVGELLDDDVLTRWRATAREVLCEVDPRVGMDMGDRMLADLRREARPRFSRALRRGIAEGAALLGGRGTQELPSGTVPARHAARLVADVLRAANEEGSGSLWASLEDVLPALAEAAPDAFLDAVQDGLNVDPSPIMGLFRDGPGYSVLFSHSPHTGLLWAIERVAWSPQHLQRATLILGELAEHDPKGRLSNRPSSTLRATFLAWYPNTDADLTHRLGVLDALRARWPQSAWELQLALLPHHRELGSHSQTPRFRDWGLEWHPPGAAELVQTVHEVVGRVAEDAGVDPKRWSALVEHLYVLAPQDRAMLLERLSSLDATEMEPQDRLALWRSLIDEGERHLSFPNADWSLERSQAEELIAAAERLDDEDQPDRHARLFDQRRRLPDIAPGDFEAQEKAVTALREQAAGEVLERHGVDGLKRLAGVSRFPNFVGQAAAAREDNLTGELLPLLGGEGAHAAMAAGWTGRRVRQHGIEWVRQQLDAVELDADGQAALMLELPADDQAWDLLDGLSPEAQARYWQVARPFNLDSASLVRAVEALLEQQRPWAAVDVLVGGTRGGGVPEPELIERVLEQAATSDQVDAAVHAGWEVGQLLDVLETEGLAPDRLARLEFAYFVLIDDIRPARALEVALASDPDLFVQLMRHAFVRADGQDDSETRAELSTHAWQILHDVRRLPGTDDNGSIDTGQLHAWTTSARSALAEVDRADVGDVKIGEFLSRSPAGEDGIWPAESVRDLIEALHSAPFEDGISCGRFNQRGTTVRDPYDGGAQEAALAVSLRTDAERIEARWTRTARILRQMADGYEADARQYDREAERRADNA